MNRDSAFFLWDPLGNWHYCRFCKHLHSLTEKFTCDAFPKGIPPELLAGISRRSSGYFVAGRICLPGPQVKPSQEWPPPARTISA
jgi:hypothetical protein